MLFQVERSVFHFPIGIGTKTEVEHQGEKMAYFMR